jgi:hypothetical protein
VDYMESFSCGIPQETHCTLKKLEAIIEVQRTSGLMKALYVGANSRQDSSC